MIKVTVKDYETWISDLISIHASLDRWYNFAQGFLGQRKILLEAKQGIDKLKLLIEFLIRAKDEK